MVLERAYGVGLMADARSGRWGKKSAATKGHVPRRPTPAFLTLPAPPPPALPAFYLYPINQNKAQRRDL